MLGIEHWRGEPKGAGRSLQSDAKDNMHPREDAKNLLKSLQFVKFVLLDIKTSKCCLLEGTSCSPQGGVSSQCTQDSRYYYAACCRYLAVRLHSLGSNRLIAEPRSS